MDNLNFDSPKKEGSKLSQTVIGALAVLIIILIISNAATIRQIIKQKTGDSDNLKTVLINYNTNLNSEFISPDNNLNVDFENINTATSFTDIQIPANENQIKVAWHTPVLIKQKDFFTTQELAAMKTNPNASQDYFIEFITIHEVGIINSGFYNNQKLYNLVFSIAWNGPGFNDNNLYHVTKNANDEIIIIAKNSADLNYLPAINFVLDQQSEILGLETPESISIPGSNVKLVKSASDSTIFSEQGLTQLFKYNDTEYIYKNSGNDCFLAKAADSTIQYYNLKLDFTNPKDNNPDYYTPSVYNFILNEGSKNKFDYSLVTSGGCGWTNSCYTYASYIKNSDQLNIIGQTIKNGPIYVLKDTNQKSKPENQASVLKEFYDSSAPGWDYETNTSLPAISFADFLKKNPIIYWQDPFGQFLEFHNADFAPMAECGKPVIYLYPEETTDVSVQVNPTGGFKFTEPAYNNGWFVKAEPNGKLYNYTDKQNYPYLFWEGYALNYQRPNEGFVIAQKDVEEFLAQKLAAFGLIPIEYNEFIEFWAPKMKISPYYFITFVPQDDFDKLAPLQVYPHPDTIIRVFMDYQGLDSYVKVKPQIIKKTERLGFTVVEWGGAMHK